MDKVFSTAFTYWNLGVHKLIELAGKYQLGEHVNHYKYGAWVVIFAVLAFSFVFMAFMTLSAMGTIPRYSAWAARLCFRSAFLATVPATIYGYQYGLSRTDYYSMNVIYVIASIWLSGVMLTALYLVSGTIQFAIACCCPIPDRDHID